ncbi:MAG: hypothetical protein PHC28_15265 [Flavobacterium sp.]|uniref:hypothetical protein n=1 Tax=Flavobacterium sp. TaxID=239 RepID=UPI00260542A8|nr:hypothetical protein [Flavobacterium sp.]MDD5151813.1 hypothetical protein [Flavobacterium sp.]
MKSNLIVLFSFLFAVNTFSQTVFTTTNSDKKTKSKPTYIQYDITAAIKGNPNAGETNEYTKEKESWFLPDGLGAKIGYGLHYNNWVALGIHTGINWEWTNKLVVVPIFANFKLSPKIGEETRITLQTGMGKSVALGRGSLSGDYKKISLGLQSDAVLFFIEVSQYDFRINNQRNSGNISLGISLISF